MKPPSRILIVTSGPLSRNPRPCKEAIALAAGGYAVTVAGVFESEHYRGLDAALLAGSGVAQVALRPGPAGKLWRKLCRRLAAGGSGWWERPAILGPGALLLRTARRLPSDLVIVHNEAPFWAGAQLLQSGRRVAADFEDWYSEDLLPASRRGRPLRLLRAVERALLERAAYVSTTSHALAGALHAAYGGPPARVITNSFPLQPAPAPPSSDGPPAFFWFSQTIGPGRGLEELLAGLRHTRRPSRLVLLGRVDSAYRAHLLAAAPAAGAAALEFLAPVAPLELPAVIARHHVGLALEQKSPPSRDLTITNKILQYLNAGLAVAASETAGQREVFAAAPDIGCLLDLSDPRGLGRSLDELIADPARRLASARAARRLAETRYCWEKESAKLLAAVAGALGGPPAAG